MIDYLSRKVPDHEAFFKKYAAKKYMKASIFVREWVRSEIAEHREIFLTPPPETRPTEYKGIATSKTRHSEEDKENVTEWEEEEEYAMAEESREDDFIRADQLEAHEVEES
jgi:hypothetical protein